MEEIRWISSILDAAYTTVSGIFFWFSRSQGLSSKGPGVAGMLYCTLKSTTG